MKNCYLAAICCFAPYFLWAQGTVQWNGDQSGTIHLESLAGDITLTETPAGNVVWLENGTRILRQGAPDVPKLTAAVIVDDSQEMEVVVTHESFTEYTDVYVAPSKGNLSRSIDPATVPYTFGPEYTTNAFYPGTLAGLGEAFVQSQYRGQAVHFYPVQYNPVTHTLRVYHQIEVEVIPTATPGFNPLPAIVPDRTGLVMNEVYGSRFLNYTAHQDRYEAISEIGNMLVIAHAQYLDELEPWVQWKKEKGIGVEVVDVATIPTLTAVNNFIEEYYLENGLTYLVVVGDEDQVPVQLVNNASGQGYCDACYGYISGNDHYSEIFVGRLLVHTDDELVPVIDKILEYEKNPYVATDWFSVAMGIGSNEGDGFGDDGEADWEHNNAIKEDLLGFTYTSVYERYDGNHTSSSPTGGTTADGSGNPSASSLSEVINNGCTLINYTGHGNHDVIVTGSFTNTNINGLNNHHKYPYWIIVGCCVGDYDDDSGSGDTFGEAWLKTDNPAQPTGGIGGAFSSVFQSWAPPMEGQDEMNELIAGIGTYATRHTLGSIHFHGCAAMNDEYGNDGHDMTDTWTMMGDPSVQLRTAFPYAITGNHAATLFIGQNELDVATNADDGLVCLTLDGEIIATAVATLGYATLQFPVLTQPATLLLTITSFNGIPYQAEIDVIPAEGPYVLSTSQVVDDISGNDNGLADFTETVFLDVTLENIGIELATGVEAVLSTSDPNVTITSDTYGVGDVDLGAVIQVDNAFVFEVANDVDDQHVVTFILTLTDDQGNTWTTDFPVVLNAPFLECVYPHWIDDSTGNNNGQPDSGETVVVHTFILNSGHAATLDGISGTLSDNSPYTDLPTPTTAIGNLAPGETGEITFPMSVAMDAPLGEQVLLGFETVSGAYDQMCAYMDDLNLVMEDWETGDVSQYNWILEGDENWFVSTNDPFEGAYCMESGNIGNSEQTILKIVLQLPQADDVTFSYRVSSEQNYDFLRFRVNGLTIASWSGEVEWAQYTQTLQAGTQTLRWIYEKDNIVTGGEDAAWVDNIILPPGAFVSIAEEHVAPDTFVLYPNPATDAVTLAINLEQPSTMQLTAEDQLGRTIEVLRLPTAAAGEQFYRIDTSSWAPGVYLLRVTTSHGSMVQRLVIH